MSKHAAVSIVGRPAGFSSSEDEWEMGDEDGESCLELNYTFQRPLQSVSVNTQSEPNLDEPTNRGFGEFVWTKDSCAKRVNHGMKSLPVTAVQMPTDESPVSSSSSKKKAMSQGGEERAINFDWVDKILQDATTCEGANAAVPNGSVQVDEQWLAEISQTWMMKAKKNSSFALIVVRCLEEVPNPYTTSLYIMENFHNHIASKKPQVVNAYLQVFDGWISENRCRCEQCLNEHIQLRAFAFVVRTLMTCSLDLVVKCFQLDSAKNPDSYIAVITQLLNKDEYLKASRCIAALSLQERFTLEEVCLPLLLQGHNGTEIEDYLLGHHDHQIQFVQMLDQFVDPNYDFDHFYSKCMVPRIRKDLLAPKNILKLVTRLTKLYQIPDDICPLTCRQRCLKAMHFLIYRKYIHKDIGDQQWEELIRVSVEGNEFLQLNFIDKVIDEFYDLETAAKAASWFQLPTDRLPFALKIHLTENKLSGSATETEEFSPSHDETVSGVKEADTVQYHSFMLPVESIHWVDSRDSFLQCVYHVKGCGPLVGFDSEWRPLMAQICGNRMALLQLAVRDAVFLLDMVVLVAELNDEDWILLGREVLCSDQMLPLAYGFEEDWMALVKAVPVLQQFADKMKIIDLAVIHLIIRKHAASNPVTGSGDGAETEPECSEKTERERGLSELVKLCLGRPLDKSQQMSDWERRPLRNDQKLYGALDAYCLLEVYGVLKKRGSEFNISSEILDSGHKVALRKTKLEKRQQKIKQQNHFKANKDTVPTSSSSDSGVGHPVISPGSLRLVCDTMLTGLGRHLRRCGVDVVLLKDGDSHDVAAQVARKEGRIVLTSGVPYFVLRTQLPPGRCFNVRGNRVSNQVIEVLQHFNVTVTASDIFSRCLICNGGEYLQVHSKELREAWRKKLGVSSDTDVVGTYLVDGYDHLDLDSLQLQNGVPILLEKIPEAKFDQVDVFFICANCGKVYWEGVHHKRVNQLMAPLIEAVDSNS